MGFGSKAIAKAFAIGALLALLLPATSAASDRQTTSELRQKLRGQRLLPAVVELDLPRPFSPEHALTARNRQLQRSSIAEAGRAVRHDLATLGSDSAARIKVKSYRFIPHLTMQIDEAALDVLLRSQEVRRVREQISGRLLLSSSTARSGARLMWSRGQSGRGWTVAVLDGGVHKNHEFLRGKIVREACFSLNQCPGGRQGEYEGAAGLCPSGPFGVVYCSHGTQVSSIAAGRDPTDYYSGVAKDADIVHATVTSYPGLGFLTWYEQDLLSGLNYIYRLRSVEGVQNIAAVNLSLGSAHRYSSHCDDVAPAITDAISNLGSVGIATVAGSGNDAAIFGVEGIKLPACISSVVSVGSTNQADEISAFTDRSPILTMLAPGDRITAATFGPGSPLRSDYGTSFAAPHVTGAWAVLKQARPDATVSEVKSALTGGGRPIYDPITGLSFPRLQIDSAAEALGGFSWRPSSGSWESVGSLPRQAAKTSLASWGSGHLALFVVDSNGELHQRTFSGGSWGSSWSSIDPPLGRSFASVEAISRGGGQLLLVASTTDGSLFARIYRDGAWSEWYGWDGPSSNAVVDLAATESGSDAIDVVAVDTAGDLFHRSFRGTWGEWAYLQGPYSNWITDAAVVSRGPGEVDLLATDSDGLLNYRRYASGRWGPWEWRWSSHVDGGFLWRVDAASWGGSRLDVVAADVYAGTVGHMSATGSAWSELRDHGGEGVGGLNDIALTTWAPFRLDLIAGSGLIGHRHWRS